MTLKCKMCGANITAQNEATIAVCEYCGSTQALPKVISDRKANLIDRAEHFRRSNDFDKAEVIYEQILLEDNTDAEIYWSLVLCRYGIEYVKDPATQQMMPTVHRTQFESVIADDNYRLAMEKADIRQRMFYEKEAKKIDAIQQGILDVSRKEKPFDVFICYKETDDNGRRTRDSVTAQELYDSLTKEGFKVFFARITLEDKLGEAYEPYIFAALNSAKVMVALGSKSEYFNAVWVRNEWSRFLKLMKEKPGEKILIPAYKDMDPYDLPDEFSHLQAQDMGKLGFMQDLVRGMRKLTRNEKEEKEKTQRTVATSENLPDFDDFIHKIENQMSDRQFESASVLIEDVLKHNAYNSYVYLLRFMCRNYILDLSDYFYNSISNVTGDLLETVFIDSDLKKAQAYAGEREKGIIENAKSKAFKKWNEDQQFFYESVKDRLSLSPAVWMTGYFKTLYDEINENCGRLPKGTDEKSLLDECEKKESECKMMFDRQKYLDDIVKRLHKNVSFDKMNGYYDELAIEIRNNVEKFPDNTDTDNLISECEHLKKVKNSEMVYRTALEKINTIQNTVIPQEVFDMLVSINGYMDSAYILNKCEKYNKCITGVKWNTSISKLKKIHNLLEDFGNFAPAKNYAKDIEMKIMSKKVGAVFFGIMGLCFLVPILLFSVERIKDAVREKSIYKSLPGGEKEYEKENVTIALADNTGRIKFHTVDVVRRSEERMLDILTALVKYSAEGIEGNRGFINPQSRILGFSYENGWAWVDVSAEFLDGRSESEIQTAIQQIRSTISVEYPDMKKFTLLCDKQQYDF